MMLLVINGYDAHTSNMIYFYCLETSKVRGGQLYGRFFIGAPIIQGVTLLFRFSSTCAHYSREHSVQGGTLADIYLCTGMY